MNNLVKLAETYELLSKLDRQTSDEITRYLTHTDRSLQDVDLELRTLQGQELEIWLANKLELEGPPDFEFIYFIGKQGKIKRPVIVDFDQKFTVEGRHRLFAALEYNLPCPIIFIMEKQKHES